MRHHECTRLWAVAVGGLIASCASGKMGALESTTTMVDEKGGVASSADGVLKVTIAAGAVSRSTAIVIETERHLPLVTGQSTPAYAVSPDLAVAAQIQIRDDAVPSNAIAVLTEIKNGVTTEVSRNYSATTKSVSANVQLHAAVYLAVTESDPVVLHGITSCCPNQYVEIDLSTGALTHVSDVGDASIGFTQGAQAVDLSSHRLFLGLSASLGTSGAIQSYLGIIQTQTGSISRIPVDQAITYLGFDSVGQKLYGVVQNAQVFSFVRIDPQTGALTPLRTIQAQAGLLIGPAGLDSGRHRFFYDFETNGDPAQGTVLHHLGIIDTRTGDLGDVPLSFGMAPLFFDDLDDRLFGITAIHGSPGANDFDAIDPATGALTTLANVGGASFWFVSSAFAVDPRAHRFFLQRSTSTDPTERLLSIDTQTGSITASTALARSLFVLVAE